MRLVGSIVQGLGFRAEADEGGHPRFTCGFLNVNDGSAWGILLFWILSVVWRTRTAPRNRGFEEGFYVGPMTAPYGWYKSSPRA